ncbi:MAG: DUF4147 domain-containing protein [Phycisphaerales bacterium]
MADSIVRTILEAAEPGAAVERAWSDDLLPDGPVTLIAYGKASVAMANVAVARLGDRVRDGVVVAVPSHVEAFDPRGRPVRAFAADHPLPTERNLRAADEVERVAQSVGEGASVLVLISGGASAQLTAPAAGLTLDDVRAATDAMLRAGATIGELNAVRKHCDRIKGGRLAAMLAPARVVGLVVSDVMGDRLDVVSSGPTAPDPSTFRDALDAIERRGARVPAAVVGHLRAGARGERPETPKPHDPVFVNVAHRVIANNAIAVAALVEKLERDGYRVEARSGVEGEAAEVGRALGRAVRGGSPGSAIVWGGETTVTVGSATGVGGRNQELALAATRPIVGEHDACVLSFGTDGVDGPTDAAGGFVTNRTANELAEAGIDFDGALARHDSNRALDAVDGLIRTGPTGTNVNDVMVGWRPDRG